MTPAEVRRYYGAALSFARLARGLIRRRVARAIHPRLKPDRSFVTDVDLAVERALRAAIRRRFPTHGIVGEEFPPHRPDAALRWILDPIDGTTSLRHGIPFYGSIIALHHHDRPIAAVIDVPGIGRRYSAGLGLGSWCNGRRLQIRDVTRRDLPLEVISIGDRPRFVKLGLGRAFDRLQRADVQLRSYVDCIAHVFAAEGLIAAVVDYGVKLWDIAATQLLVEEAGGRYVCPYRSRGREPRQYGIIAGKPTVVRWLEQLFT